MNRSLAAVAWWAFVGGAALCGAAQDQSHDAATIDRLLEQAASAEQAQNADEAVTLLRAALELDASHVVANVRLGRLLCAKGETPEGIGLLYHAMQLDPKNVEGALALIDAELAERDDYFQNGDASNADASLTRANDVLERCLKSGATTTDELELRRVYILTRTDEKGYAAFELAAKLVTAAPDDQRFHAALVDAATAGKDFDAALAFYESSAAPPWLKMWFSASVHAARATANYNHFVDDEQVVKDYLDGDRLILEAARLNPDVFDAASERASFYRSWAGWTRFTRQQRTEEAWDLFMSAIGRNPKNDNAVEGISYVGARLYEAGDLEKARELYRQACEIASERHDFWNNYGLICRDTGQFEESFRAYRRAMALEPGDARTINDTALILLYHLHRDLDLCERWLIRAEDLARAAMADAQRNEDEALATEQRDVLGDALANLARLYTDQGRMQEAGEHWNELRAVNPKRPELPENGGH